MHFCGVLYSTIILLLLIHVIIARDSIYAIARICYRPSVCPPVRLSVCHTGGSVKNA